MKLSADSLAGARLVLSFVLELATRVWPDGLGPEGESFEGAWRRKVGAERPKPPPLALHFYPGGVVVVVRQGQAVEIRQLPRRDSPAETAIETASRIVGGRVRDAQERAETLIASLFGGRRS